MNFLKLSVLVAVYVMALNAKASVHEATHELAHATDKEFVATKIQ